MSVLFNRRLLALLLVLAGTSAVVDAEDTDLCYCCVEPLYLYGGTLPRFAKLWVVADAYLNPAIDCGAIPTQILDDNPEVNAIQAFLPVCPMIDSCGGWTTRVSGFDIAVRNFIIYKCDLGAPTANISYAGPPLWPSNVASNATEWSVARADADPWTNVQSQSRGWQILAGTRYNTTVDTNPYFNTQGRNAVAPFPNENNVHNVSSFVSAWIFIENSWRTSTEERQVTLWARWSNNSVPVTCLEHLEACAVYGMIGISLPSSSSSPVWTFDTMGGNVNFSVTAASLQWGAWNHVAITFYNYTMGFWWNGLLLRTHDTEIPLAIGGAPDFVPPNIQTHVFLQSYNFGTVDRAFNWSEVSNGIVVAPFHSPLSTVDDIPHNETITPDILVLPGATLLIETQSATTSNVTFSGFMQHSGNITVVDEGWPTTVYWQQSYRVMSNASRTATLRMTLQHHVIVVAGLLMAPANSSSTTKITPVLPAGGLVGFSNTTGILMINASSVAMIVNATQIFRLATTVLNQTNYMLVYNSTVQSWYLFLANPASSTSALWWLALPVGILLVLGIGGIIYASSSSSSSTKPAWPRRSIRRY